MIEFNINQNKIIEVKINKFHTHHSFNHTKIISV
uniref:Uncharacterized protein n=1 Tax=Chondria sp. (in: red algae) TaxID=1982705 RepID=A0A1Z1MR51_9FLOR|nr:hypothetical protein [Chondria sp. (in: red algae)]